jgi:hypothetical protein
MTIFLVINNKRYIECTLINLFTTIFRRRKINTKIARLILQVVSDIADKKS